MTKFVKRIPPTRSERMANLPCDATYVIREELHDRILVRVEKRGWTEDGADYIERVLTKHLDQVEKDDPYEYEDGSAS